MSKIKSSSSTFIAPEVIETLFLLFVGLWTCWNVYSNVADTRHVVTLALALFLSTALFSCSHQGEVCLPYTSLKDYRPKADAGLFAGICLVPMVLLTILTRMAQHDVDGDWLEYLEDVTEMALQMGIWTLANVAWTNGRGISRWITLIGCGLAGWTATIELATAGVPKLDFVLQGLLCSTSLWILLRVLPASFTLGEASILCQMLVLLGHDAFLVFWARIGWYKSHLLEVIPLERPVIYIMLQSLVLGMILIGILTWPLLRQLGMGSGDRNQLALMFYGIFGLVVAVVIAPWTWFMIERDPITWTLEFVLGKRDRLTLVIYWLIILGMVALLSPWLTKPSDSLKSLHYKRKFYHAIAVTMFLPGYLWEPDFMFLAFAVALSAFVFVEYIREAKIPPFGEMIDLFLKRFVDDRDVGKSILAHIYLLLGCALPMWFSIGLKSRLGGLAGVFTIGIGDAMASFIGLEYGRHKWPGVSKSIEGTLAYIVAVFSIMMMVSPKSDPINLLFTVTITGLVEAFSRQNDNLLLPLLGYVLWS